MISKILIISREDDAHIPFVKKYLEKDSTVILDPQTILSGNELSYEITQNRTEIIYKGMPLTQIKSVWYRKPDYPKKKDLPVPEGFLDYSYDAIIKHMRGIHDHFQDALWMSDYYAIIKASSKTHQLDLAHKLGFLTPETLVTSYLQSAKRFLEKYPNTIMKPQSQFGYHLDDGSYNLFYTTTISKKKRLDLTNLDLAPTIFQKEIQDIVGDIRVTVVGNKTFAAFITNPGFDEKKYHVRDWRIGHQAGTIKIENFDKEFPKEIADLCIAYVKKQNLTFGAIDLILDKKGRYWFLENNPNGQWGFVEEGTGQKIGEEIAHFLVYGKNK